jgi:hypothetical protein
LASQCQQNYNWAIPSHTFSRIPRPGEGWNHQICSIPPSNADERVL